MVKGLKSMWRQAAPIVRSTLQGALQRIIMQDNVKAAVTYVEGQIRRLLSGRVEMSELIMTGGLWRITGQQVPPPLLISVPGFPYQLLTNLRLYGPSSAPPDVIAGVRILSLRFRLHPRDVQH